MQSCTWPRGAMGSKTSRLRYCLFLRWRHAPQLALLSGASCLVALVLIRSGRIRSAMLLPLLSITYAIMHLAARSDGIQNIALAILPVPQMAACSATCSAVGCIMLSSARVDPFRPDKVGHVASSVEHHLCNHALGREERWDPKHRACDTACSSDGGMLRNLLCCRVHHA